ncbi:MAG: transposase [Deltaproteobacteria bacterium]|nr:transposase [Deltaproteobacteria bacterium]
MSCWVGDIGRFANAKKLTSYFGIAPRVSGGPHQVAVCLSQFL